MGEKLSILTMNYGGVVEAVDTALQKIAANIADINTPPDKPRELILKIRIKPDQNRTFGNAQITVTPKLQPEEAQVVSIIMDKENGEPAMFEAFADHNPEQARLDGTLPSDLRDKPANITPFKAKAAN